MNLSIDTIDFQKYPDNLVPAIVQDVASKQVLMLGFMNQEAVEKTLKTKAVTFFSRSKQRLWTKGETSGNTLKLVSITIDCDQDTLLIQAQAPKATCHTGSFSCFGEKEESSNFLQELFDIIEQRKNEKLEGSYVSSLFEKGLGKIAQKVGEEGVETVIAALHETDERLVSESADLLFHLLVLLSAKNISLEQVVQELQKRHQK